MRPSFKANLRESKSQSLSLSLTIAVAVTSQLQSGLKHTTVPPSITKTSCQQVSQLIYDATQLLDRSLSLSRNRYRYRSPSLSLSRRSCSRNQSIPQHLFPSQRHPISKYLRLYAMPQGLSLAFTLSHNATGSLVAYTRCHPMPQGLSLRLSA